MQLVGATWWFIRWPFLFEGVFIGLIGSVIALCVVWACWRPWPGRCRLQTCRCSCPGSMCRNGRYSPG